MGWVASELVGLSRDEVGRPGISWVAPECVIPVSAGLPRNWMCYPGMSWVEPGSGGSFRDEADCPWDGMCYSEMRLVVPEWCGLPGMECVILILDGLLPDEKS